MFHQDLNRPDLLDNALVDQKINVAVLHLWTDALLSLLRPTIHSPLSIIRHEFVKSKDATNHEAF